jgi:hypothetical protein
MAETIDGSKDLARDSKAGIAVGALVTTLALAFVEWLGTIDFSTMPTIVSTMGALAAGWVANAITAWAVARRKTATAVS